MNDLLTLAVEAHGGLHRWDVFKTLRAELSVDGAIWHMKRRPGLLADKIFEIETHTEHLTITPFAAPDRRSATRNATLPFVLLLLFGSSLGCAVAALGAFIVDGLLAWHGLHKEGPLPAMQRQSVWHAPGVTISGQRGLPHWLSDAMRQGRKVTFRTDREIPATR
jgi:hypothetical protein